jgi:hypothetical protein
MDQKNQVKNQLELQRYQKDVDTSIEERAKAKEQMNTSTFESINQQALMQEAQQYAEQLMQIDEGSRRSQLDEMAKTNYIMYGVVKAIIEMQKNKMGYEIQKQVKDGGEQQPQQ